jgi:hypothetical protein
MSEETFICRGAFFLLMIIISAITLPAIATMIAVFMFYGWVWKYCWDRHQSKNEDK